LTSTGAAADEARTQFKEILGRKGHAVDNAREAVTRLELAFDEGALQRTPEIDQVLADLSVALDQEADQKLGGKSAEAARFITRRLAQLVDDA
jgi:hypothetical protein